MSKDVITYFEDDSEEPLLGLTPTIRIRNVADNSLIITDASMEEIGDGAYKYTFASYDSTINYFIRCNAGVAIKGRYNAISTNQDLELDILAIPTSPLLTNDSRLDHLDADVSSRLSTIGYIAPDNTSIADIKADVENVTYGLSAIKTDTGNTVTSVNTMAVDVALIKKVESKRWKIINNQMIFYDDDNTTPILTFDLKDDLGNPTMSSPFERMPV